MLFERLQIPHQLGHLTLNARFLFSRVLEELNFKDVTIGTIVFFS